MRAACRWYSSFMRAHLLRPLAALCAVLAVGCSESGGSVTFTDEDVPPSDLPAVDAATPPPDAVDAPAPPPLDAPADAVRDVPLFVDSGSRTNVCGACTGPADCGADGVCVQVAVGARACLPRCNPDVPTCPGRLRCVRDVALADVAVCAPIGGVCCIDGDNDGYGTGVGCRGPDCDDADPARTTSGAEECNGRDDDCDGMTDEGLSRACTTACGSGTEACSGGTWRGCTARAPIDEVCDNGADDDCDGMTDEGCTTMMTVPMCTGAGPTVESATGDYVILANYDGGRLVIDVDQPITALAIVAYEPLDVVLSGTFAAGLRRVHIVGYNSMMARVSGVSAGIVERAGMPPATLTDPAGYAQMVCASTCSPGADPGGCNTLAQVLDYFRVTLGPGRRWWHMQYSTFTGATFRVSRGGCCV
jgi:hypothetical protein